jgi:hypothetical protein
MQDLEVVRGAETVAEAEDRNEAMEINDHFI